MPPDGADELNAANAALTRTILVAERKMPGTAAYRAAWQEVEQLERRRVALTAAGSLENAIARRGALSAQAKAAGGVRRISVEWGGARVVVEMQQYADVWEGAFGAVRVVEYLNLRGESYAHASVALPAILDPCDGYEHELDSGSEPDVFRAVMALWLKLSDLSAWVAAVMAPEATP